MTHTWLRWPPGIPKDEAARLRKLEQIRADRDRPDTPENRAEDRRRIAVKVAEIQGQGGLFQQ